MDDLTLTYNTETPPTAPTFHVAVLGDVHANRPYKPVHGSRALHTRLGNGKATGLLALPHHVDHVVFAGDMLEQESWQPSLDGIDDRYGLSHRDDPRAFMETLLGADPTTQHHFAVGNHEGKSASDKESPIVAMLHDLADQYPNLHVSDYVAIGNMLVCHGHQFLHKIRPHASEELGQFEICASDGSLVQAWDKHDLAEKMCDHVSTIQQFLDRELSHVPPGGQADVYVYFSHSHSWFDERVVYPPEAPDMASSSADGGTLLPATPRLNVHVSNLGCLLPGRKANYKCVSFQDGAVQRVEPLDLAELGKTPRVR